MTNNLLCYIHPNQGWKNSKELVHAIFCQDYQLELSTTPTDVRPACFFSWKYCKEPLTVGILLWTLRLVVNEAVIHFIQTASIRVIWRTVVTVRQIRFCFNERATSLSSLLGCLKPHSVSQTCLLEPIVLDLYLKLAFLGLQFYFFKMCLKMTGDGPRVLSFAGHFSTFSVLSERKASL